MYVVLTIRENRVFNGLVKAIGPVPVHDADFHHMLLIEIADEPSHLFGI